MLQGKPGHWRKPLAAAVIAAGLGTVTAVTAAPASADVANATCANATLTGTYNDVTVPAGDTCTLDGATVEHDFNANGAASVTITDGYIGHDVNITGTTGQVSLSDPHELIIGHDLNITGTTGQVWVTDPRISHDANLTNNWGPLFFEGNWVGHDLNVNNDTGAVTVAGNTVGGTASCNNDPGLAGGCNTVT